MKGEMAFGELAWNFEKFLVDGEGKVLRRIGSQLDPYTYEKDIQKLIGWAPNATSQMQIM